MVGGVNSIPRDSELKGYSQDKTDKSDFQSVASGKLNTPGEVWYMSQR